MGKNISGPLEKKLANFTFSCVLLNFNLLNNNNNNSLFNNLYLSLTCLAVLNCSHISSLSLPLSLSIPLSLSLSLVPFYPSYSLLSSLALPLSFCPISFSHSLTLQYLLLSFSLSALNKPHRPVSSYFLSLFLAFLSFYLFLSFILNYLSLFPSERLMEMS